jgi:type IV fimbrial biogenesis protein FimT
LIELMIGLAIVAILLAAGAPSFATFIQNSRIRNTADAIQNGVSLARAEAVRRNTGVRFVSQGGGAWTVQCEAATDCGVIQSRSDSEGSTNATVTPSELNASHVTVSTPVFTSFLTFTGLGKVSTLTLPIGNLAAFDVTNPAGGTCAAANGPMRCLRVEVSSGGQVRMCDPKLDNSGDPQACK